MQHSNTRYAYIAPQQKQAKRIVWGMAKYYARTIPGVLFNNSELLIKYPNGSEIMVLGSDNPDSLRGIALWGCFLDEYPQQSPIIFTEIVTKCLADNQGYCIFGGTPKGKGHFFRIFEVAQKFPQEWCLVYKTIDQSLEEESGPVIENLKKSLDDDRKLVEQGIMTEDEFMQEWYCSFEAAIKGAVYLKQLSAARKDGRIIKFNFDSTLPVYTVWDLGIGDATAIGFYQRLNGQTYLIDYYENTNLGLPHYIKIVKEKPYVYGKHFAPHDIRKREYSTEKTIQFTAKKLGITFEVVPSISLKDGIDLARALWSHLWIDSVKCELFIDLIGQYHYDFDIERRVNRATPVHDFSSHAADQLRYAAIIEDLMSIDEVAPTPQSPISPVEDEYMGEEDPALSGTPDGYGKHPMLRNVRIGDL